MITISSGMLSNMESDTRNPTAEILVSWNDVLSSGEWFILDQSLLDNNSLLTSRSYLDGETILELIAGNDGKLYDDESPYLKMLEGYSELVGDSLHYATSDLDFELDNSTNRFTPRASKNLLTNSGFEKSKIGWNEALPGVFVVDNYSAVINNYVILEPDFSHYQSFLNVNSSILDSCSVSLKRKGILSGNVFASIYAHSGTYGVSSVPTGSPLAVSNSINIQEIPLDYTEISFLFSNLNRITLSAATHYVMVISSTASTTLMTNEVHLGIDYGSPVHAGNSGYYDPAWQFDADTDLIFSVYGTATGDTASVVIDESSPRSGIRDLQINNPALEEAYVFSDIMELNEIGKIAYPTVENLNYSASVYVSGSGIMNFSLFAYDQSASGVSNISGGYICGTTKSFHVY